MSRAKITVQDFVGIPGQEGRLPVVQHPYRIEAAELYNFRASR